MISAANRANVTFDTVDPKGLVTHSQGGEGVSLLSEAAGEIRAAQMSGGAGYVSRAEARAMANAIAAIRSNPVLWLRDLSRQTGGFTIANTNDTEKPLKTAMDNLETYYEASYVPTISVYNGAFRRITVHVDQPGVKVLTRSGYFALPPLKGGQHVAAYELPLLKAMSASPTPPRGLPPCRRGAVRHAWAQSRVYVDRAGSLEGAEFRTPEGPQDRRS